MVGSKPLPRPEVVSKIWDYIKKNKLQNPQNKREIMADEKLQAVFGKNRVSMFEMNKHLAQHLRARPKRNRMIAKACTLPLRYVDGLQGRSAVAYRESAWLRGLPTLKLPNQRCQEQRFEIADFLFGRALK